MQLCAKTGSHIRRCDHVCRRQVQLSYATADVSEPAIEELSGGGGRGGEGERGRNGDRTYVVDRSALISSSISDHLNNIATASFASISLEWAKTGNWKLGWG